MENVKSRRNRLKILTASGSALILITFLFAAMASMSWKNEESQALSIQDQSILTVQAEDPLAAFQKDREQVREEEIRQLNAIIADSRTSEDIRASAQRQLLALCDWIEKEVTLEGILRARGYANVLATVHTDSVNILLRTAEITQSDAAVILDLTMRETGQSGGNIKIIPIN